MRKGPIIELIIAIILIVLFLVAWLVFKNIKTTDWIMLVCGILILSAAVMGFRNPK